MGNLVVFFMVSGGQSYLGQDGMEAWISESAGASTDPTPFVLVVVLTEVLRIRVGRVSQFNLHAF
jgi:hypothetical protein